jgi:hypothetical protein
MSIKELLKLKYVKMSNEELLKEGFTQAQIDAGEHLPQVGGAASNSTTIITDLNSVITTGFSATAQTNAQAAAGPLQDLQGMVYSLLRDAQSMAAKLAYLVGGSQVIASYTAPTGGPITSAADSAIYNKLVGILQILQ